MHTGQILWGEGGLSRRRQSPPFPQNSGPPGLSTAPTRTKLETSRAIQILETNPAKPFIPHIHHLTPFVNGGGTMHSCHGQSGGSLFGGTTYTCTCSMTDLLPCPNFIPYGKFWCQAPRSLQSNQVAQWVVPIYHGHNLKKKLSYNYNIIVS